MKTVWYCVAVLFLAGPGVRADQQTTEAGQQTMTARRTKKPVTIDGVFSPGEWSAAIPVHVTAVRPGEAPGLVPGGMFVSDNQADSSFRIYAMYDVDNLYIAVDVADDRIINDNEVLPFLDDDVEVFIDGDNQPWDLHSINFFPDEVGVLPNNEGFQLVTTAGNTRAVYPSPLVEVDWDSQAGLRPRGFLIETRIALDSINTIDNSWWTTTGIPYDPDATFSPVFRRPQPGDSIGFNVTVADDDCGRLDNNPDNAWEDSWARTDLNPNPSSYTAWDGSSPNWYYADEEGWGTLFLAP